MRKFDAYSRVALRQRRGSWLVRNWAPVSMVSVGAIGIIAICVSVLVASSPPSLTWYLTGVTNGFALAVVPWLLSTAHLAHDKAAITDLRGAWGEENTRDVLRSARRRRAIVGWIDSIRLQAGDLDHVVVTRSGEVVVIDSKWRSELSAKGPHEMAEAADRARRRAEGILRSQLRSERGNHRAAGTATPVTSLVVVWGPAQSRVPEAARIGNVHFVAGRELRRWLSAREGQGKRREAKDLLAKLEDFRETAYAGSTDRR